MATCYFVDEAAGAVVRIAEKLVEKISALATDGWQVIRAKLEHESLPSLGRYDATHYHEIHVKLRLPTTSYQRDYECLRSLGEQHQFVPSRNPLDTDDDGVTQFVNQRIYAGTQADADSSVDAMLVALKREDFEVIEVKRETVVFDTDQQLDAWWIQE